MSIQHRPLVFLDIETTGGSPVSSRITELGAVRVENGQPVATMSQLVNPGQPVPSFITRLTGIDDAMLWDAPAFAAVADDLERFLEDAVFVAHNVQFDYGFIKAEFQRIGRQFTMDRFCTAMLSRRLYPQQRRHNLDTIIATHNIPMVNRHRAFDDAQALQYFFERAVEQHGLDTYAMVNRILTTAITPRPRSSGQQMADL